MKRSTDSDLLDQEQRHGESFDFEEVYKRFEKLKLDNQFSKEEADQIEKLISELDNYLQNLLENNDDSNAKKSFIYAEKLIKEWLSIDKNIEIAQYFTLSNNLSNLKNEIQSNQKSIDKLHKKLVVISNRKLFERVKRNPCTPEKYKGFSVIDTSSFPFTPKYYWDIDIILHGDSFKASMVAEFLLVFSSALENTDGCYVTIGEIKAGSLIAKMRIWFKNLKSKEETKKLLNLGRKSALGYLEKPSSENDKIKKETEKTQVEIEMLQNQITSLPTDLLIEREKLLNRKLEAEVEQIEIENVKKRVELINSFSDLLAKNLLKPQNMEILINQMLFVNKKENVLSIGVNLNSIDSETKNLK